MKHLYAFFYASLCVDDFAMYVADFEILTLHVFSLKLATSEVLTTINDSKIANYFLFQDEQTVKRGI